MRLPLLTNILSTLLLLWVAAMLAKMNLWCWGFAGMFTMTPGFLINYWAWLDGTRWDIKARSIMCWRNPRIRRVWSRRKILAMKICRGTRRLPRPLIWKWNLQEMWLKMRISFMLRVHESSIMGIELGKCGCSRKLSCWGLIQGYGYRAKDEAAVVLVDGFIGRQRIRV